MAAEVIQLDPDPLHPRLTCPVVHPNAEVTLWIQDTMPVDIAAYALILTPGSRWFVPPEYLIGHASELLQLIELARRWDLALWLEREFDDTSRTRDLTDMELEGWYDVAENIQNLTEKLTALIEKLGVVRQ